MQSSESLSPYRGSGLRLLLAALLVALNLRGAITSLGPLLETIQAQYHLTGAAAGTLASLPLFAFALLSPYAAALARRIGIEQAILVSLLLLILGLAVRYIENTYFMYIGTALVGCGIAISNVLLPGLFRRDFAQYLASVTALFTMTMVVFGALGSGLSIPLASFGGWRFSLLAWSLPALVALVFWIPRLRKNCAPQTSDVSANKVNLWKHPLAWQVSLFMAAQSTAFYVLLAWFPAMMNDLAGITAARAGWILFVYQLVVLVAVMGVPVYIRRFRDQRWIGAGCGALIMIAYSGLFLKPEMVMFWMLIKGAGAGGALVLAFTLFGLRTESAMQTVSLSGMAQAVGYTMAAIIPILIGFIHDITGFWTVPLLLMIGIAFLQVISGWLSGRPVTIPAEENSAA